MQLNLSRVAVLGASLFLCFCLPSAAYEPEARQNAVLPNWEAKPLKRVQPEYPFPARTSGSEGWVHLSFSLDQSGHPIEINIVDSYPEDLFNEAALKAVKEWVYLTPAPADSRIQTIITFLMSGEVGVRSDLLAKRLDKARKLIDQTDGLDEATELMEKASKTRRLNIYELALVEQTMGLIAQKRGDHEKAVAHLQRAKTLGRRFNDDPVYGQGLRVTTINAILRSYIAVGADQVALKMYADHMKDNPNDSISWDVTSKLKELQSRNRSN